MMDEREFERWVCACRQKLYRVCCAILPDTADREDAIQEALTHRGGEMRIGALLFSNGGALGMTEGAEKMLEGWRQG